MNGDDVSPWDIAQLTTQDYEKHSSDNDNENMGNLFISASKEFLQDHKAKCVSMDGLCLSCKVSIALIATIITIFTCIPLFAYKSN